MGMFDYVEIDEDVKCHNCGESLRGSGDFQTKVGDCTLSTIKLSEIKDSYGNCEKCNEWNYITQINKFIATPFIETPF